MTWNGVQGFTSAPNETLTLNGVTVGTYHTERNLTFLTIDSQSASLFYEFRAIR